MNLAFVGNRCPAQQLVVAVEQNDIDAAICQRQRHATTLKATSQNADAHTSGACNPCEATGTTGHPLTNAFMNCQLKLLPQASQYGRRAEVQIWTKLKTLTTLSREFQSVNLRRRPRKQRGLLGFAVLRREALEGVEDHPIAALALVGGKVALEHGAVGAE